MRTRRLSFLVCTLMVCLSPRAAGLPIVSTARQTVRYDLQGRMAGKQINKQLYIENKQKKL